MTPAHPGVSLSAAFTREHQQIDAGIEAYLEARAADPGAASAHLQRAMLALRRHIYLEEQIVFPHLAGAPLMMPLLVMYREHGQLWRRMDALAAALESPENVSELAAGCREILQLLERHNSKEEPIIYPHMDADLDEGQQAAVRDLLGTGVLPGRWRPREA